MIKRVNSVMLLYAVNYPTSKEQANMLLLQEKVILLVFICLPVLYLQAMVEKQLIMTYFSVIPL